MGRRPYLLQVCVQLLQHHFQLVHLACQIQGRLLAGKMGDRQDPLIPEVLGSPFLIAAERAWRRSSGGSQLLALLLDVLHPTRAPALVWMGGVGAQACGKLGVCPPCSVPSPEDGPRVCLGRNSSHCDNLTEHETKSQAHRHPRSTQQAHVPF